MTPAETRVLTRQYVVVVRTSSREEAAPPAADAPTRLETFRSPGSANRGGLLFSAGGSRFARFVPEGGLMAGARLQLAAALGGDSRGFLSTATLGVAGGMDVGRFQGVDAQLWHMGLVLAVAAPWSRDVFGIGIEAGLIGGSYYDGNPNAYRRSTALMVKGPYGEPIGPSGYALLRPAFRLPVRGPVAPFAAAELGGVRREDGQLCELVSLTAGVVWNAW